MKIQVKQTDGTELNLECIYIVIHIDKKEFIISGVKQINILKDAPEALQITPESQSSITLQ